MQKPVPGGSFFRICDLPLLKFRGLSAQKRSPSKRGSLSEKCTFLLSFLCFSAHPLPVFRRWPAVRIQVVTFGNHCKQPQIFLHHTCKYFCTSLNSSPSVLVFNQFQQVYKRAQNILRYCLPTNTLPSPETPMTTCSASSSMTICSTSSFVKISPGHTIGTPGG